MSSQSYVYYPFHETSRYASLPKLRVMPIYAGLRAIFEEYCAVGFHVMEERRRNLPPQLNGYNDLGEK